MDVRARRHAAGLTQADLSRRAKVPQPNLSAYETGRRQPSPAVLERLSRALRVPATDRIAAHRDEIRAIVSRHHATDPRIFGSVARGCATSTSDLDLLVDFSGDASLLDEIGLRLALEDLLDLEVDVVGSDSLQGDVRERILLEAIPL